MTSVIKNLVKSGSLSTKDKQGSCTKTSHEGAYTRLPQNIGLNNHKVFNNSSANMET